jgi:hypothetical protein
MAVEQGLFLARAFSVARRSRTTRQPIITRSGRTRITPLVTRSGRARQTPIYSYQPRARAKATPITTFRRFGAVNFGDSAVAPVLFTAAAQLGFRAGRRRRAGKKRARRLAKPPRGGSRGRSRGRASRSPLAFHGRRSTGSASAARAVQTIGRMLVRAKTAQKASAAVTRALPRLTELKVHGKRLDPQKPLRAAQKAAAAQAKAAHRAAEVAAAARAAAARAAAKAEKAQARALESNARVVQRAHDRAQKTLERADAKAAKAADKAVKAVERARAADAKAAAKQAKDGTLAEKLTEFVRGRLHLPNAATAISVATGLPMPGVNPDAVAQQDECREADDKRRNRVARQARCAGVPCADQGVPAELPENVVRFPKPKG